MWQEAYAKLPSNLLWPLQFNAPHFVKLTANFHSDTVALSSSAGPSHRLEKDQWKAMKFHSECSKHHNRITQDVHTTIYWAFAFHFCEVINTWNLTFICPPLDGIHYCNNPAQVHCWKTFTTKFTNLPPHYNHVLPYLCWSSNLYIGTTDGKSFIFSHNL
jgi:hypothetical protein